MNIFTNRSIFTSPDGNLVIGQAHATLAVAKLLAELVDLSDRS